MPYNRHNWQPKEMITAERINNIEDGLENIEGCYANLLLLLKKKLADDTEDRIFINAMNSCMGFEGTLNFYNKKSIDINTGELISGIKPIPPTNIYNVSGVTDYIPVNTDHVFLPVTAYIPIRTFFCYDENKEYLGKVGHTTENHYYNIECKPSTKYIRFTFERPTTDLDILSKDTQGKIAIINNKKYVLIEGTNYEIIQDTPNQIVIPETGSITLEVKTSGNNLEYQWEVANRVLDAPGTFAPIDGETNSEIILKPSSNGEYHDTYLRCKIINSGLNTFIYSNVTYVIEDGWIS